MSASSFRHARRSLAVAVALLAACGGHEPAPRPAAAADDAARPVPRRIVSLNPATTELLFAIGAGDRVIGRSRWDQWPAAARAVPELGDAIRPGVERVLAARPDLVVLYASADNRAAAEALRKAGVHVVSLRTDRIADLEEAVVRLGALTARAEQARAAVDTLRRSLDAVRARVAGAARPSVFVHVWDAPLITIGAASYLSELIEVAGGRNAYADLEAPSPQVAFEDLARRDPDVILAGPRAIARLSADPAWRALRAVRTGRLVALDTTLMGRPSLRLGEAARALARQLHPDRAMP